MTDILKASSGLSGYERVVLTSDLSEASLRAAVPAAELARSMGWSLTLLCVIHDPVLGGMATLTIPEDCEDAKKFLAEVREELPSDLSIEVAVLTDENVAKAIARFAQEHKGVIVMSSHGRTGVRRLIVGSVAEEVLRQSTVPVFCIPLRGDS